MPRAKLRLGRGELQHGLPLQDEAAPICGRCGRDLPTIPVDARCPDCTARDHRENRTRARRWLPIIRRTLGGAS